MTSLVPMLMVDSSVVVKWRIATEDFVQQAKELFQDWRSGLITVCISDQLPIEITSAFLRVMRRHPPMLGLQDAQGAVRECLRAPFVVFRSRGSRLLMRALEIASVYGLRLYDCVHVAIAERKRIEFWTGDRRLYNALHTAFPFICWIGDYQCRRPLP